ncbi:MAG: septal ring lytic transglycosylase RlpA family protein [Hyphomicrobiaceae bacterium]
MFGASDAKAYSQTGIASYYWQGRLTANGERYRPDGISAAHKTLPFGTRVKVTHIASGRSIVVRINDRGPFVRGRIIDLSRGAAGALGIKGAGLARVRIEVVGGGSGKATRTAKHYKKKHKKHYASAQKRNWKKKSKRVDAVVAANDTPKSVKKRAKKQ